MARAIFIVLMVLLIHVQPALAQSASVATAAPTASATASPATVPQSAMKPEQAQAAEAAIIKQSQNPVGNIAIVPFQNNFNYGYGPYVRDQYNLNIQPVVPIMLTPDLTLIARIITPFFNQPSKRSTHRVRVDVRMPLDVRHRGFESAILPCAEDQAGSAYLGRGRPILVSDGECAGVDRGQIRCRARDRRAHHAGQHRDGRLGHPDVLVCR